MRNARASRCQLSVVVIFLSLTHLSFSQGSPRRYYRETEERLAAGETALIAEVKRTPTSSEKGVKLFSGFMTVMTIQTLWGTSSGDIELEFTPQHGYNPHRHFTIGQRYLMYLRPSGKEHGRPQIPESYSLDQLQRTDPDMISAIPVIGKLEDETDDAGWLKVLIELLEGKNSALHRYAIRKLVVISHAKDQRDWKRIQSVLSDFISDSARTMKLREYALHRISGFAKDEKRNLWPEKLISVCLHILEDDHSRTVRRQAAGAILSMSTTGGFERPKLTYTPVLAGLLRAFARELDPKVTLELAFAITRIGSAKHESLLGGLSGLSEDKKRCLSEIRQHWMAEGESPVDQRAVPGFPYLGEDAIPQVSGKAAILVKRLREAGVKWLTEKMEVHAGGRISLRLSGEEANNLALLKGMHVTNLEISDTKFADLSPIQGLPLKNLVLWPCEVEDLSPLGAMSLTNLTINTTKVFDLAPLKGMPLRSLNIIGSPVKDLSPLQGAPIEMLFMSGTKVTDLSPLKGMRLKLLMASYGPVRDLSPLRGMPLRDLWLSGTEVEDLSPLQGMPIERLELERTKVADLSPLKGMPLESLALCRTRVTDLSPLKGCPLLAVYFDPAKITHGLDVLRSMKSLERLGVDHTKWSWPDRFWERYDAGELHKDRAKKKK